MTRIALALILTAAAAACSTKEGPYSDARSEPRMAPPIVSEGTIAYMEGKPGPMAPNRQIAEHDCSKPVDATSGNLRCR